MGPNWDLPFRGFHVIPKGVTSIRSLRYLLVHLQCARCQVQELKPTNNSCSEFPGFLFSERWEDRSANSHARLHMCGWCLQKYREDGELCPGWQQERASLCSCLSWHRWQAASGTRKGRGGCTDRKERNRTERALQVRSAMWGSTGWFRDDAGEALQPKALPIPRYPVSQSLPARHLVTQSQCRSQLCLGRNFHSRKYKLISL